MNFGTTGELSGVFEGAVLSRVGGTEDADADMHGDAAAIKYKIIIYTPDGSMKTNEFASPSQRRVAAKIVAAAEGDPCLVFVNHGRIKFQLVEIPDFQECS